MREAHRLRMYLIWAGLNSVAGRGQHQEVAIRCHGLDVL